MRITTRTTQTSIMNALEKSYERLSLYQKQTASGKRIFDASDDPVGVSRIFWLSTEIDKNTQFQLNIDRALDEFNATDFAFRNMLDRLLRVKEISVNASSGLNSTVQLQTYGYEVQEILQQFVSYGNSVINGKYIFAGYQTNGPAFTATTVGGLITAVTYNGDTGQRSMEVEEGRTEIVNFVGDNTADPTVPGAFIDSNAPGVDIFQFLIDLRDNLLAGNYGAIIATDQSDISRYANLLENLEGQLAVKIDELGVFKDTLVESSNFKVNLRSDEEDADYFTAASNLSNEQTAYQVALQIGARIIPATLFDFLK